MTRKELRATGAQMRTRLTSAAPAHESVPGLADFMDEVVYGAIWSRPGLSVPDRMICTLAVLSPLQRLDTLQRMVVAALDVGLPARAILEVFMQTGLYAGFVTTETSAALAQRVFGERGIDVPSEPARSESFDDLDRMGVAVMQKLHGARSQQGYASPGNAVTGSLYPAAIRYGYGDLWSRPGLDHRQRMLCAIACFTAMGLTDQLLKFGQSALNIGLSKTEVIEAVIQTGPYGGFPRALNGLGLLAEVLK